MGPHVNAVRTVWEWRRFARVAIPLREAEGGFAGLEGRGTGFWRRNFEVVRSSMEVFWRDLMAS